MAQGGTNGQVKAVATSDSAGRGAVVVFPSLPGPPPTEPREEIYTDLSQASYDALQNAMNHGHPVDCTVDANGKCNGVTQKKA